MLNDPDCQAVLAALKESPWYPREPDAAEPKRIQPNVKRYSLRRRSTPWMGG